MTAHFDCHIILPSGEDLRANAEPIPGVTGIVAKVGVPTLDPDDL